MATMSTERLDGRFILDDRVAPGWLTIEDGWIVAIDLHGGSNARSGDGPLIAPGFVDVHVHGWGGHDAMGGREALDGMSRALLRRGVTSFLPTAVTAPLDELARFADSVRAWTPASPADGAGPLGYNLEGPFLAPSRRGAHHPDHLRVPAEVDGAAIEPLLDGLRLITIAPELDGAVDLIASLAERGIAVSLGHTAADYETASRGYAAGASSTTHLFNAMTGIDHRSPGVVVAALTEDVVFVELIADGQHVHPAIWPLITGPKSPDRLLLVSDAIAMAGQGDGPARIGELEVDVVGGRATLRGTSTLAGSVIALDTALRQLAGAGLPLSDAVAAVTRVPLALIGVTDRGRIAVGQRADLVELSEDLTVRRVMRNGTWVAGAT